MPATYTLQATDYKTKLDFSAVGNDIIITIPENTGDFSADWSCMLSLLAGTKLSLIRASGSINIQADISYIVRPNDLFYLINLDGANNWKAIRAGNFIFTTTNREIISAPKELVSGDPIYQFIGCAAASQTVVLPDPPSAGDRFVIKNIIPNQFDIEIKETLAGLPIFTLGPSSALYQMEFVYTGTEWNGWG